MDLLHLFPQPFVETYSISYLSRLLKQARVFLHPPGCKLNFYYTLIQAAYCGQMDLIEHR